jgi:hypothetical protein
MDNPDRQEGLPRSNLPLYHEGYYARLVANGERPPHGYPTNHLPKPAIQEMTTQTGYVVSLNNGK